MQNVHVLRRKLHFLRVQNITVLESLILFLACKTLPLHSRHIQDIQLRQRGFEIRRLLVGDLFGLKHVLDHICRDLQGFRTDHDKTDSRIAGHRVDQ